MRFKSQILFKVNRKRIRKSSKVCLNNNPNKTILFILIILLNNLNQFKIRRDKARDKRYNSNNNPFKLYHWMMYLTKSNNKLKLKATINLKNLIKYKSLQNNPQLYLFQILINNS